jgi:hypothetical protein
MSQYLCPECGEDSRVMETRPSYTRLRRRRVCNGKGHKFSTVEVPLDGPDKIAELVNFALQNSHPDDPADMRQDMISYVRSEAREILLGLTEVALSEERDQ